MRVLGITGGIGSGKSVVAKILKMLGISVYDTDSVSKKICNSSQNIREKLSEKFGSVLYQKKKLNSSMLASLIFTQAKHLEFVNSVIHSEVLCDFFNWKNQQKKKTFIGIETSILFESGFDKWVDITINVYAPIQIRIQRLQEKKSLEQKDILNRINNQLTDKERIAKANYTIINDDKYPILPQIEKLLTILFKFLSK